MGSYTNGYVTNAIWKVNGEDKGWGPEYYIIQAKMPL